VLFGFGLSQRDCSMALVRTTVVTTPGIRLTHSRMLTRVAVNMDANLQDKIVVERAGVRLLIVYPELRQKLKNHIGLYL
jgi:hypothetical protein